MKKILHAHPGGTVLFLGRVIHFIPEELRFFLEEQGMVYADRYEGQEVALLVLSSLLTPQEEQISYDLYDAGIPDVTLEQFERYYTQHLKPQTLLMSLKLSQDQDRLQRLLGNEAFEDHFFLKLFEMFDWGGEGIHERDENRDVTISFVKRFFRPDGFRDPAMVYAPTTVMIIAKDSSDPKVLEAILTMPNHEIKTSRYEQKKPKNLKEAVAFNPHIATATMRKLLAYNDTSIDYFLASNSALPEEDLERIYQRADTQTKQMMAHNTLLPESLFRKLLQEDVAVQQSLLSYQPIDLKRLEQVILHPQIAYIGANESIAKYLPQLLALEHEALDRALAANGAVSAEHQELLYCRHGEGVAAALASNSALGERMAWELYRKEQPEIIAALAANPSTPREILDSLCEREEHTLNRCLAANPSVDLYWLRQFQLDTSLVRILAENETYGKSILKGLGL